MDSGGACETPIRDEKGLSFTQPQADELVHRGHDVYGHKETTKMALSARAANYAADLIDRGEL